MAKIFKTLIQAAAVGGVLAAGGFAAEASAAGYLVNSQAVTYNFPNYDRLNMRKWPASHSAPKFKIKRYRKVFVERCIVKRGSDWCLIQNANKPWKRGWVNGRFIKAGGQNFSTPHPFAYGWH